MTKTPETIASVAELQDRLAQILSKGTLYRPFIYRGEKLDITHMPSFESGQVTYGMLPKAIRMFCEHERCNGEQWWEIYDPQIYLQDRLQPKSYVCKSCDQNETNFWIIWQKQSGEDRTFIKAGQWPPLTIEPPRTLAKALGDADTKLYKKALINASISHGLAALVYFRRVIENKVNALLDLVAEAAKAAQVDPSSLQQLEEVKNSKHVDVKIEYAAKLLPAHLRPGGNNPLERLYGVASSGLHGESDDECLSLFLEYKHAFEYLFENLTEQNEHAKEYVKTLSKPTRP